MSKKRNEQRELALKELVTEFERNLSRREVSFLAEEQFEGPLKSLLQRRRLRPNPDGSRHRHLPAHLHPRVLQMGKP